MEQSTGASAIFHTTHRRGATLSHHRHRGPFATIIACGSYIELQGREPRRCVAGQSLVVHGETEEHADYFLDDVLCLNVELRHTCEPRIVSIDAELQRLIARVLYAVCRRPALVQECASDLQALLGERSLRAPTVPPVWFQHVIDGFPWCDAIPLREAAKEAGIHPVQFSRAFRAHRGMSPSQFRLRARLERASELLLETGLGLARIAADCGFADQSHLTRTFNEALGLSPGRFQRAFAR